MNEMFNLGYADGYDGTKDNPYTQGTVEYAEYEKGWVSGDEDYCEDDDEKGWVCEDDDFDDYEDNEDEDETNDVEDVY